MRCPHCAAPHASGDVCRTCGTPRTAPVVQPRLDALEVTRAPDVQVTVTRLPDLLTTDEEFGDVSIPGDEPAAARPAQCRRCGTPAGSSRLCETCGIALWSVGPRATSAVPSTARCGACGVPNPADSERCVACGQKAT